jgi:hypothetical protein
VLYIEPALASASASLPPQTSTKKVGSPLLEWLTLLWHGCVRSQSIRFSCFGPATPQREHCGDNENLFKLQVEHPSLRPLRHITSTEPAAPFPSFECRSIIAPLRMVNNFSFTKSQASSSGPRRASESFRIHRRATLLVFGWRFKQK